ncbi:MAG: glycoside hydrolase family 16 protein [Actinobacteria bacterium]|nr:glycoside hydrolase family 16 protein [Actinomycetota bacterium]
MARVNLRRVIAIPVLAALSGVLLVAPPISAGAATTKYKLLWADEFNAKKGTLPSSKSWDFDLTNAYGWGNSELEYYTKKPANISTDGAGHLLITAKRISDVSGMTFGTDPTSDQILNSCPECQFTSAKIKTANKLGFLYGRIEMRMKNASGVGTWPAFWMLGDDILHGSLWPECGEIDILETQGRLPEIASGTIHGPNIGPNAGAGYGGNYNNLTPLSDGYHTYTFDWKKNQLDFLVDNKLYLTITPQSVSPGRWVFNHEFFLILNLAMGGLFTGDIDPALNQAQLSIDYIRFYSINGVGRLIKH